MPGSLDQSNASNNQDNDLGSPLTYHGVNLTVSNLPASVRQGISQGGGVFEHIGFQKGTAALSSNPSYLLRLYTSNTADPNAPSNPFVLYSLLGSLQVQSLYFSSGQTNNPSNADPSDPSKPDPNSPPGFPFNGTVAGTLAGANVPGCQRSVKFPSSPGGVPVSYAPGECMIDNLLLNTFNGNVNVDTIVLCAASLPNGLTTDVDYTDPMHPNP